MLYAVQACAHRYKMVSPSFRWGLGQCLSLSNALDEEEVWSPCEGRSKSGGHNEYGFCQAGVSCSINKVRIALSSFLPGYLFTWYSRTRRKLRIRPRALRMSIRKQVHLVISVRV